MQVSITKAVDLTGVSRTTIYNDKKSGKLTVGTDGKGKPSIDVAELERVYGSLKIGQGANNASTSKDVSNDVNAAQSSFTPTSSNTSPLAETAILRQHIELLQVERERERKQFEAQIDTLNDTVTRAQEGQSKVTMLLEHHQQSGAGEWEKSLHALEERIANQEDSDKIHKIREQKILRQNQALKKALQAEKSKGFFKRIFG